MLKLLRTGRPTLVLGVRVGIHKLHTGECSSFFRCAPEGVPWFRFSRGAQAQAQEILQQKLMGFSSSGGAPTYSRQANGQDSPPGLADLWPTRCYSRRPCSSSRDSQAEAQGILKQWRCPRRCSMALLLLWHPRRRYMAPSAPCAKLRRGMRKLSRTRRPQATAPRR